MVCRSSLHALVALLVVVTICTAGVGFVSATEDAGGTEQSAEVRQLGESAQSTSASHENPGEATEPEEPEGIEEHLESLLADRLAEATDESTDGDYEDAREPLGEGYDETLAQYAEVVGESEAEPYSEARDRHTEFIDAGERFDERREAYRDAREGGDNEQADELRGDLQDDAADISERGEELSSSYQTLEAETGIDHSDEIEQIETRQTGVDEFLSQTTDAGQVNTLLLVEADRTNISFDEPARINGQLQTASGEPVDDQEVSIAVGSQTYDVETDAVGQFEITHHPVDSLGETTLDVVFRPNETSEYRATQREIPVTVEQVEAEIQLEPPESTASVDSDHPTEGTVVAGELDRPVPGVSLAVFVDGQQLETVDTDDSGEFSVETPIPRSTDSGTVDIEVRTVETDQAIGSASETTQGQIEPASTSIALDVEADEADSETVDISGSLETEGGTPIRDSTVGLTVDGETVETVNTNLEGSFSETIRLPETTDNSTATVGATFGGEGHLEATTETVEIRTQPAAFDGGGETQPSSPQNAGEPSIAGLPARELLFVGGGLLGLFGLVGLWWVRRDRAVPTAAYDVAEPPPRSDVDGSSDESTPASSRELYSAAERQLAADAYDGAVVLAYAAVRRQLGELLGLPEGVTHRELAQSYPPSDHEDSEALEQLTQQYEQVRYAADGVDESTAVRAVSAAEEILDSVDTSEQEGA